MKSISCNIIIGSIRAKVDGSIGATFSTPELTSEEKAYFFEMQNKNLSMVLTPFDEVSEEIHKVDKELEQKTQAQRMRNVLFIVWKQEPQGYTFEEYYKYRTEKMIESLKEEIE